MNLDFQTSTELAAKYEHLFMFKTIVRLWTPNVDRLVVAGARPSTLLVL